MTLTSNKPMAYRLPPTSGSLMVREVSVAAPLYLQSKDLSVVRSELITKNLLQERLLRSKQTKVGRVVRLLSQLSDDEIAFLSIGDLADRSYLMWAANCRYYHFLGEFAEEVLRENFLTLRSSVTHVDYDNFYQVKSLVHASMGNVTKFSYAKMRQVTFQMLREANLVNNLLAIEPAVPSAELVSLLRGVASGYPRFFPIRTVS